MAFSHSDDVGYEYLLICGGMDYLLEAHIPRIWIVDFSHLAM